MVLKLYEPQPKPGRRRGTNPARVTARKGGSRRAGAQRMGAGRLGAQRAETRKSEGAQWESEGWGAQHFAGHFCETPAAGVQRRGPARRWVSRRRVRQRLCSDLVERVTQDLLHRHPPDSSSLGNAQPVQQLKKNTVHGLYRQLQEKAFSSKQVEATVGTSHGSLGKFVADLAASLKVTCGAVPAKTRTKTRTGFGLGFGFGVGFGSGTIVNIRIKVIFRLWFWFWLRL